MSGCLFLTHSTAAVIQVTNLDDVGPGSLRGAIANANDGDTIQFAAGLLSNANATVLAVSSEIVMGKSVAVVGPGDLSGTNTPSLILQGTGSGRIFSLQSGAVTISGLGFTEGAANSSGGGAIRVDANATLSLSRCDFWKNDAGPGGLGGAILNYGNLTADECLIGGPETDAANTADSGGGIANLGVLLVKTSLFQNNLATASGGAVFTGDGTAEIQSSTLASNVSLEGGALAAVASGNKKPVVTVLGTTIVANLAASQGGALLALGNGAEIGVGGSILSDNVESGNPGDLRTEKKGRIYSLDYNLLKKPGETFSPNGPNDLVGLDPLLGDLADNGGRTATYAPGDVSPVLDHVAPALFSGIEFDQRGQPRVSEGNGDIGAFEFRDGCTLPPTVTLNGNAVANVECGSVYQDPGAVATDCLGDPLEVAVTASGGATIEPSTGQVTFPGLGIYTLSYTADDGVNSPTTLVRTVTVRDTVAPVLDPLAVGQAEFSPPGSCSKSVLLSDLASQGLAFTATDGCDGAPGVFFELTQGDPGSEFTFPRDFPVGTTQVFVFARDISLNESQRQFFSVVVNDVTPPVIHVPGGFPATLQWGDSFDDTGVAATDLCSSPVTLSRLIELDGGVVPTVGTCVPGDYIVTYTAMDAVGNMASVVKTVAVQASVSLPAVSMVERSITTADCFVTVDLSGIVSVDGVPPACPDTVSISVVVDLPGITEPAMLAALEPFDFPVGDSEVSVSVLIAEGPLAGTELANVGFTVRVDDPLGICETNVVWPSAKTIETIDDGSGVKVGFFQQAIARAGESRWFRISAGPGGQVRVRLRDLPANYDVVLYGNIQQAYDELLGLIDAGSPETEQLLALLGAEFAPEAYSPEAYSPEAYSPEAYSPEAYSPEAYSPEAYSPEAYSPEAYSPEAYSPEAYSPEAYSPEAYSPEAYSPEAYSPEAYSSAQQRSLVAFSASPGTVSESIGVNTYTRSGDFYIRIRGQNGVFLLAAPFLLEVEIEDGLCNNLTNLDTTFAGPAAPTGDPQSLILWDSSVLPGDVATLTGTLGLFANAADAVVVDLAGDTQLAALRTQADVDNPSCPLAKNLVAEYIRSVIVAYRQAAPSIANIVLVGNDRVIPFFRTADEALLAAEENYVPPVFDNTQSQASLGFNQVLTQDRYGSSCQVFLATGPFDLLEIPVGRLVENAAEVNAYLLAYLPFFNGVEASDGLIPTPSSFFTSAYDFLVDSALAMTDEFSGGMGGGGSITQLITPADAPPAFGWTADQLRAQILNQRFDVMYLAGHFSTSGALAADYTTRFTAGELAGSSVDMRNVIVLSPGCHSGYNTVNVDAVPIVTEQPDWAEAFARQFAIFITGTGYQYGDTDFIEYTERLHVGIARALRKGAPISVGQAIVEAKQRYLAETAIMRGIHEKTLNQLVLYGLPMVKVDLLAPPPGGGGAGDPPLVDLPPVAAGSPGANFGLQSKSLNLVPDLTLFSETLDIVGTDQQIVAQYFAGSDGIVSVPAEPVRALESIDVGAASTALVRGVGFRGGSFTDISGFVPFTGAAATEVRGVHGGFLSEVFFPQRIWSLNQLSLLCGNGGTSVLNVFPTQFTSGNADTSDNTLRRFDGMEFVVYYCDDRSDAAIANPPAINVVASSADAGGVVQVSVDVAASTNVGVQEVWITYTALTGPDAGQWQSLPLNSPVNPGAPSAAEASIGTWTLDIMPASNLEDVRFIVQAVNGVGVTSMNGNFGRFFRVGESTLDDVGSSGAPTALDFAVEPPASGTYREMINVSAQLTGVAAGDLPKRVYLRLGPVVKSALTDTSGFVSADLVLTARPGPYELEVVFPGDSDYASAAAVRAFQLDKAPTTLDVQTSEFSIGNSGVLVELTASDGTPLKERTILFVLEDESGVLSTIATAEITDGAGQARLTRTDLPSGRYSIAAYFGMPATEFPEIALNDPLYAGTRTPSFGEPPIIIEVIDELDFDGEQAWLGYSDQSAPGASSDNRGLSSVEIVGDFTGDDPAFGPFDILSSDRARRVEASIRATLSGQLLVEGTIRLRVTTSGRTWRGSANLGGTGVDYHVDWNANGEGGRYHVWLDIPSGSGPLYDDLPAVLNAQLIFGTDVGAGETPFGGTSVVGDANQPWTSENPNSRVYNP